MLTTRGTAKVRDFDRDLLKKPSPWLLLRVWIGLGLHSFGGGTATLYLIRRAVVERHHWLSDAEFTRAWSICQMTPGINLLALTILIGRRCGGLRGIVLALVGLLLPSVSITILLAAVYTSIRDLPVVAAGVRGIIPATVGLGGLLAWRMAVPLLRESRGEGSPSIGISLGVLAGSTLAAQLLRPPVVLILLAAGAVGALASALMRRRQP